VQIAPVWRAERPQKGRYRQFVQCDIDIIGDASARAEAELAVATLDTLDALGLAGAVVRVNDRRLLDWMLASFGFAEESRPSVLITVDKLDKIGREGVVAELGSRGHDVDAVRAVDAYLAAQFTGDDSASTGFTEDGIRARLPEGAPDEVVAHLAALGAAVAAARATDDIPLRFDPFLVRGMGYYTGTIFELEHPSVPYSLAGGGRYDGMIGRFLGQDVPAVGFSIGFERIVDLVTDADDDGAPSVVLVHDRDLSVGSLLALKARLVAEGSRVRVEQRTKNLKALLERAAADGYTTFATVGAETTRADLELKRFD
jgi:histidyl-tRNA synthetase